MKFSFLFLLVLFHSHLYAQEFLFTGRVEDEFQHPIAGAVIKITQNKVRAFAITNALGSFQFNKESFNLSDSIEIEVTHISYKNKNVTIFPNDLQNAYILFTLEKSIKPLQEIFVKPDIYENGDTTFINAEAFRKTADKNVNDILKNIPGFTVTLFGVFYNGKLISEVYIENLKLSDNYLDITTNLNSGLIQEIQVIKNFSEIVALRGFDVSENTVLNLVIYKNNKLKASGNFTASLGIKDKYLFDVNAILLRNRLKALILADLNNIGFKPYNAQQVKKNLLDYNRNNFSDSRLFSYYSEPAFFYDDQNSIEVIPGINASKNLISNFILPFKNNKFNLNINNSIYNDKFSRQRDVTTLYFTNPGFNYSERYSQQFSPHFYKLGTELTYNDSAMYAKIALGYNTRRFTDQQNIFSENYFQDIKLSKKQSKQLGLYFVRKISGKAALECLFFYNTRSVNQQLKSTSLDSTPFWNKKVLQKGQSYQLGINSTEAEMNFYLKNLPIHKIHLNATSGRLFPESNTWAKTTANQQLDSFHYNDRLNKNELLLNMAGSFSLGKANFKYTTGLFTSLVKQNNKKYWFLFPIANFAATFKISTKGQFNLGIRLEKPSFLNSNITPVPYLTSYRSMSYSHPGQYYKSGLNYSLNYYRNKISSGSFFIINFSSTCYSPGEGNQVQTPFPGFFITESYTFSKPGNASQSFFIQTSNFIKKLNVGVRANVSGSRSKIFSETNTLHQLNMKCEILVKKKFFDYLAIESGILFYLDQMEQQGQKNNRWYPLIEASSKANSLINYDISYKPIFIHAGSSNTQYHGLNGVIVISPPKKKYSFKIICTNMVNQNYILGAVTNTFNTVVNRDFVMQRYILFQFSSWIK